VVVVAGHAAIAFVLDGARAGAEIIPPALPAPVFGCRALNLVCRCGNAPDEVFWESHFELRITNYELRIEFSLVIRNS
jgi:hypothetical protein